MTIEQVLIGDGIKFNNRKRILNYFKKRNQSLDADVHIDMIPKIREELDRELIYSILKQFLCYLPEKFKNCVENICFHIYGN